MKYDLPGFVMLNVEGMELTPEDKNILEHPSVGGLILFSRNFYSVEQLQQLIKTIRVARPAPFLIAVDQEGGRVQRFREGFARLPSLGKLGVCYNKNPAQAKKLAQTAAWVMATEILAMGIDFSFAPVLDVNNPASKVIADRAFHSSPQIVFELAQQYIISLHLTGMAATGKHFPGHGSIIADSHHEIPYDNREYETLLQQDLLPFKNLASQLNAILPAHVIYPQIDTQAAGFSKIWLQTILRERLQFKGAIFSDDLSMEGASSAGDHVTRAQHALTAGCDMVLICNDRIQQINILDRLQWKTTTDTATRLQAMLGRKHYPWDDLHKSQEWRQAIGELTQLEEMI